MSSTVMAFRAIHCGYGGGSVPAAEAPASMPATKAHEVHERCEGSLEEGSALSGPSSVSRHPL